MSGDNQFTPGTALDPTATVEISISCRDLLDLDVFSRSDPMVVVYNQPLGTSHNWVELIRTEVIWDCLNPDFVTKLTIDYHFEEEQVLRFEVYDIDKPSASLDLHDFIGYSECTLGQIVAAGYSGLTLPLIQKKTRYNSNKISKQSKQSNGKIILVAEELVQFKEEVTMKLKGHDMGSLRCCILPPTIFYVLSKATESGSFTVVYRSESAEGENPIWLPVTVSIRSLCNGDKDRGLQLQFFQVGFNGYHSFLGFVHTNVNRMKSLEGQTINLVGKNGNEKAATLEVLSLEISPIYTFFEYIHGGGTQIHCSFAIDFTASNGNPSDPTSLHYISPVADKTNPYEQAIGAVGEILADYDPTKLFCVFGFGARIPPRGDVSHNFPVTLEDSPFCKGIEGVLESYRKCICNVQLYGPTNFAPIIRNVANLAKEHAEDGKHYYVLLIITDGIITDMQETTEVIVEASRLPLSIIIVGVGSANFQQMDILDGDIVRLSANGVFAERDIVQFVPYRSADHWMATICPEIAGKWSASVDGTRRLAKVKLAQEVLAEIPDQLTGFMKSRGIIPKKRQSTPISATNNNATPPVPSTSNANSKSISNAIDNPS